ncbi:MAG: hypothetical protein ACKVYV_08410 [Limisphaerales bacterium]
MNWFSAPCWMLLACVAFAVLPPAGAAEQHRATRLGQPETRFAPPLHYPQDLRNRFREPLLKPDFIEVLRQWGWEGDPEDLFRAAATNEIIEVQIPVGAVMPFMSSREGRRPVCLRNVTWAGKEPISAYAFVFTSKGQRYRCVTPRPCSNFYLEDLGPEPRNALALECRAPAGVPVGHPAEVCFTVRNTGNVPESGIEVTLQVPPGATITNLSADGVFADGRLRWPVDTLAPGAEQVVCAALISAQPGSLDLAAVAAGAKAPSAESRCATLVLGVPAILVEVKDVADPIEVGGQVTYTIEVTNQGSAPLKGLRLTIPVPASQEFVRGTGPAAVTPGEGVLVSEPLAQLDPQAVASWTVVLKAVQAADSRFRVEVRVENFDRPVEEVESTQQY